MLPYVEVDGSNADGSSLLLLWKLHSSIQQHREVDGSFRGSRWRLCLHGSKEMEVVEASMELDGRFNGSIWKFTVGSRCHGNSQGKSHGKFSIVFRGRFHILLSTFIYK